MERKSKILLAGAAASAFLTAGYLLIEDNIIETKYYRMSTDRGRGVRILQLSDLHDKVFGKDNKRLIKKIDEISPDLILITGDTVSSGGKNLKRTAGFLSLLCSKYQVCGILGNHEQRGDAGKFIERAIEASGVDLLKNQFSQYLINNNKVTILGLCEKQAIYRSDYIKGFFGKLCHENHDEEIKELSESDGIRILLSHFPENYALTGKTSYNKYPFEVMMSGHAHGGHVRLPLLGGLYSPGQGLFPKYSKGLYRNKENALLVSAGLGNDSPIPRFNNPPSLSVVDFI